MAYFRCGSGSAKIKGKGQFTPFKVSSPMTITNTITISGHYYIDYALFQGDSNYIINVYKNDVQIDTINTIVSGANYVGVLQKEYDFEVGDVIKMTRTNVNALVVPAYTVI